MTVASVTTDINFGPYVIPSNAQNMIMNNYAFRRGLSVEVVVPEPILSFSYATSSWLHDQFNFSDIILVSLHQLPKSKDDIEFFRDSFSGCRFHFALEGEEGVVCSELPRWLCEIGHFRNAGNISIKNTSWSQIYHMSKEYYLNGKLL